MYSGPANVPGGAVVITPPPRWEGRVGGLSEREIAEFLAVPWNGRLATVTPERTPYVTPVWYEYNPGDRTIDIVARARSVFVRHIQADPHVAFHRSEERRVGKECRSRWAPDEEKTKTAAGRD